MPLKTLGFKSSMWLGGGSEEVMELEVLCDSNIICDKIIWEGHYWIWMGPDWYLSLPLGSLGMSMDLGQYTLLRWDFNAINILHSGMFSTIIDNSHTYMLMKEDRIQLVAGDIGNRQMLPRKWLYGPHQ
ncbi:hypothetical protein PILCRDRAFT_92597 [Piloderma croceum F 1598]|uniref:Uncharacterized protein n=1 Tax=Piloderma croceum (strain F 1598) TaxID=765440 RepID=A0A0C3F3A6_PILCF|nr:hypothetical protein PILCRDRAFT_92597 [Piloderma croceum F 1598]